MTTKLQQIQQHPVVVRLHLWGQNIRSGLRWLGQKIQQHRVAIGVVGVAFVVVLIIVGYRFDWTGFNRYIGPKLAQNEQYRSEKTLWDWMQLLLIPILLAIGGFWLNQIQKDRDQKAEEAQKQREEKAAEARERLERENRVDNQRESAMQTYFDKMSELLLDKNLLNPQDYNLLNPQDKVVRNLARVRTLTVLPRLDAYRKRRVLRFLYEADLITIGNAIVDLGGADLRGADLRGADLHEADLSIADLRGADLGGADLRGAKMNNETNLSGTKLQGAIYNMQEIQKPIRPEKIAIMERTNWPQEFDYRAAKAICVDCFSVNSIVITQDPISINTEVTASATFTDIGSFDPHKSEWFWGDGTPTTPGTITESNGSGAVSDSHTYTRSGCFYIQITITANDGRTVVSQSYIHVNDPDPQITINGSGH